MHATKASEFSPRRDLSVALIVMIGFASVPLWADKGLLFLASVVMINFVFALSFNLIFGLTGLVSFGHAAFFAVGAYTTGFLLQRYTEVPFLISWIAGGAVGALVAAVIALVALRRASGIYFAILTLALAELVRILISKSTSLGREDGLTGIGRPTIDLGIFQLNLAEGNSLYYLTFLGVAFVVFLIYLIWNNRFGRLLGAIRQDPERVRFLGINVHSCQFKIFVLSGAFAGLAGGLYAPAAQILTPEVAHWSHSALPILFCLVGGASYFWGPVVGVVIFAGLEHATRNITGLSEIIVGMVLLVIVLLFPGGVLGGFSRFFNRIGGRSSAVLDPVKSH